MELKILSPKEEGFPQEIRWNNEELKAEIAGENAGIQNLGIYRGDD